MNPQSPQPPTNHDIWQQVLQHPDLQQHFGHLANWFHPDPSQRPVIQQPIEPSPATDKNEKQ